MPIRTSYEDLKPTSAPAGVEGRFYYDSTEKVLKFYDGSQWLTAVAKLEGYDGFDNNGGGTWSKYIQISADSMASEYAQYRVEITNSSIAVYSADGTEKLSDTTSGVWTDFWNNVKSDGSDIRVFNQNLAQMYFWIENWDYANQTATIWVKLSANSSEINIAYGNASATKSVFEDGEGVFEFFDDFNYPAGDLDGVNGWQDCGDINAQCNGDGTVTITSSSNFVKIVNSKEIDITDWIIEYRGRFPTSPSENDDAGVVWKSDYLTSGSGDLAFYFRKSKNYCEFLRHTAMPDDGGTDKNYISSGISIDNDYHIYRIEYIASSKTATAYVDGTQVNQQTFSAEPTGKHCGLFIHECGNTEFVFDWIRVLKLADPVNFTSTSTQTLGAMEGYDAFDNDGGGTWTHYINIPVTTIPSEYAQYKIVIQSDSIEVFSADGTSQVSGSGIADFWSRVKTDGSDIRLFDQARNQLYFWVESFDYSGQSTTIWVNLTAGSTELNIAYGNPSALKSSYENSEQVFEFFDDYDADTSSEYSKINYGDSTGGSFIIEPANSWVKTDTSNIDMAFKSLTSFNSRGYIVETEAKTEDNDGIGVGWIQSDGTGYAGTVREDSGFNGGIFKLDSTSSSFVSPTVALSSEPSLVTHHWYYIQLTLTDTEILLYVKDLEGTYEATASFSDTTYIAGSPALISASNSPEAYFKYLRVLKYADPADFGTPHITTF